MTNYEDFSLRSEFIKQMGARKGAKFARNYYKDNEEYPTQEAILEASTLNGEELEKYKRIAYGLYLSEQAIKLDIVPPEVTENTSEQNEIENNVVEQMVNGNKNVVVESGTINNITIPQEVNVLGSITGEFQDGATIKSESTKSFILNNTSEEPVSVSVESKASAYMTGKYEDVYLNGKDISVNSGNYAEISGTVTIDPSVQTNVSISAGFVGDDAAVVYPNSNTLTITNKNTDGDASLDVYAPNATVKMSGKYAEVNASVSQDTLYLNNGFHANRLNVREGRVIFYGTDIKDFVDEKVNGAVPSPYMVDVTSANLTKISSTPGIYNVVEDITITSPVTFGIVASGKFKYNLNGHTLKFGNAKNGSMYIRGSVTVDFYGDGVFQNNANSYGIWLDSTTATLNIHGGDFKAYTHVIYAYNGVVNIYGGSFQMLGNGEKDAYGNDKFLLNCYDANYTAGKAVINVFGGKFYNFNPAQSYGEPGAPVSFVAPGYHVVESEENGNRVYEVLPD